MDRIIFVAALKKSGIFLIALQSFMIGLSKLLSNVNGEYLNWPVNQDYIEKIAGKNWEIFKGEPSNLKKPVLQKCLGNCMNYL